MRQIDAEALKGKIYEIAEEYDNEHILTDVIIDAIDNAPTVVAGQDTASDCDTCALRSCLARGGLRRVNCPLWRAGNRGR